MSVNAEGPGISLGLTENLEVAPQTVDGFYELPGFPGAEIDCAYVPADVADRFMEESTEKKGTRKERINKDKLEKRYFSYSVKGWRGLKNYKHKPIPFSKEAVCVVLGALTSDQKQDFIEWIQSLVKDQEVKTAEKK